MTLNPFLFGMGPAFLALSLRAARCSAFQFISGVADKRRRGEPVRVLGLVGPVLIGILGCTRSVVVSSRAALMILACATDYGPAEAGHYLLSLSSCLRG